MTLLIGTERGLYRLDGEGDPEPVLDDGAIRSLSGGWAVTGEEVLHLESGVTAGFGGVKAYCVAALPEGDALVGTSRARLFRVAPSGAVGPVDSFDAIDGRDTWYTPWGEPPDTRSLTVGPDGSVLVNVHVGGVWRSGPALDRWEEVVAVDDDTHQVVAGGGGTVVVAAAVGVGESHDGGRTFEWSDRGLHGSYCRAVAVAGDRVLVTASTGPATRRGALYRRPLGAVDEPFVKVPPEAGLPDWFAGNIDTGQLSGAGTEVALGDDAGRLWRSSDAGDSWRPAAKDLPPVRWLSFALG